MSIAQLDRSWEKAEDCPTASPWTQACLALFASGVAMDASIGKWLGAGGARSLLSSAMFALPLVIPASLHLLTGGGIRRGAAPLAAMAAFVVLCVASVFWSSGPVDSLVTAVLTRLQLLAFVWLGYQIVRFERDVEVLLGGN